MAYEMNELTIPPISFTPTVNVSSSKFEKASGYLTEKTDIVTTCRLGIPSKEIICEIQNLSSILNSFDFKPVKEWTTFDYTELPLDKKRSVIDKEKIEVIHQIYPIFSYGIYSTTIISVLLLVFSLLNILPFGIGIGLTVISLGILIALIKEKRWMKSYV